MVKLKSTYLDCLKIGVKREVVVKFGPLKYILVLMAVLLRVF